MPKFYACGICGHNHPWDWDGDCRDDANRFTDEQLDDKYGPCGYELATMSERVVADGFDFELAAVEQAIKED